MDPTNTTGRQFIYANAQNTKGCGIFSCRIKAIIASASASANTGFIIGLVGKQASDITALARSDYKFGVSTTGSNAIVAILNGVTVASQAILPAAEDNFGNTQQHSQHGALQEQ